MDKSPPDKCSPNKVGDWINAHRENIFKRKKELSQILNKRQN